jgi:hypothetical protein
MRRNTIVAVLTGVLMLGGAFWPAPAYAQGRRGHVIISGGFGYGFGYRPFYDPLWYPYPYYGYGYGAYPLGAPISGDENATLKLESEYCRGVRWSPGRICCRGGSRLNRQG